MIDSCYIVNVLRNSGYLLLNTQFGMIGVVSKTDCKPLKRGLGWTNPYTGSLEARVQASNKEQVYGLVRPNLKRGTQWLGCQGSFIGIMPITSLPWDATINKENQLLDIDELVEFEKYMFKFKTLWIRIVHLKQFYIIFLTLMKNNQKMSMCNRLDLETLRSLPIKSNEAHMVSFFNWTPIFGS